MAPRLLDTKSSPPSGRLRKICVIVVVVVVNVSTLPSRVVSVVVMSGVIVPIVGSADEVSFEITFELLSSPFHVAAVRSKTGEVGFDLSTCGGECCNISATRTLSPVRLVLKVTLFSAIALYRGVSLFLGSIK